MNAVSSGDGGNGVKMLHKINTMISNNYLILGVFFLMVIALGLALYYFASSLMMTIFNYNTDRKSVV